MAKKKTFRKSLRKALTFGADARIDCYTVLSSLLAVMSLDDALRIINDTQTDDQKKPDNGYAPIIRAWRRSLRSQGGAEETRGTPFAAAVSPWVPNVDARIIAAAERSGNIPRAFPILISFTKRSKGVTALVLKSLWGVVSNLSLLGSIILGFSLLFAPLLENILPRRRWSGLGAFMGMVSDFFNGFIPYFLPVFFGLLIVSLILMPRWSGRLREVADNIPPFSWYANWQGGLFLLEFSSMTVAGIPDIDALQQIQSTAPRWLKGKVGAIMRELRAGASGFGEAAWRAGGSFPGKHAVRILRALGPDAADRMSEMSEMFIDGSVKRIERSVKFVAGCSKVLLMVMVLLIGSGTASIVGQILMQYGVRF